MNSSDKTTQQTDDWQQIENDVLRQSQRPECSVLQNTVKQFHPSLGKTPITTAIKHATCNVLQLQEKILHLQ